MRIFIVKDGKDLTFIAPDVNSSIHTLAGMAGWTAKTKSKTLALSLISSRSIPLLIVIRHANAALLLHMLYLRLEQMEISLGQACPKKKPECYHMEYGNGMSHCLSLCDIK